MKRKLIIMLLIALVLSLTMATLGGCFLQNLSIISGKLNSEAEASFAAFKGEAENFSQINVAYLKMAVPGQGERVTTVTTEYKVTEKGIYSHRHTVDIAPDGKATESDKEFYLEKDGDTYYVYQAEVANDGNKNWYVFGTDEDTFEKALEGKTSSIPEDNRTNLFNPANYKASDDHYAYIGEDVYYMENPGSSEVKCWYDVQGLYIDEKGFTIKGKYYPVMEGVSKEDAAQAYSQPGMPLMTASYSVYAIGTTKITFPRTVNSKND